MNGTKFDSGKPRFTLVPQGALEELIQVLEYGAAKYAVDNWKLVPDRETRYYDAAMRHLLAHRRGERVDPESGRLHLAHAMASIAFLLEDAVTSPKEKS